MCWHSLGWQVERVLCWLSSAPHATCQSQHHLSCTGHSAQRVHPALQMKEQCFTESSFSAHSSEEYHDTSQGCNSGESLHGFCCTSHSLGSLELSLPWMVVSPFVPARGAVPLSSCRDQENRKGYRETEISLILVFLPMASLSLQAGCE